MPERVWLKQDGTWALVSGTAALTHITFYVPESRLREVEAERDARRERKVALLECEEREALLRAELAALVPLLRYFVEYVEDGTYDDEDGGQAPTHDCDFIGNPESGYCEFHDKWGTARAILAREAGGA